MKDQFPSAPSWPDKKSIKPKAGEQLRVAGFVVACMMLCHVSAAQQAFNKQNAGGAIELRRYSAQVGDSFSVFIRLPATYDADPKQHFPVVYLLDGNLYFDMMGTIACKYAEVGMLPPIILVGIGYRDFSEMDSLRSRDYTFPKALPKYEMSVSGGADKFLSFLQTELMPWIDARFRTDTTARVLAGHSLGGYFTLYALARNLSSGYRPFRNYIAASPSLDYNGYWLFSHLKASTARRSMAGPGLYVTYGGLEDAEDADEPGQMKAAQTNSRLNAMMRAAGVRCKTLVFSNLAHMDTAIPTFIKGLQEALDKK